MNMQKALVCQVRSHGSFITQFGIEAGKSVDLFISASGTLSNPPFEHQLGLAASLGGVSRAWTRTHVGLSPFSAVSGPLSSLKLQQYPKWLQDSHTPGSVPGLCGWSPGVILVGGGSLPLAGMVFLS